MATIQWRPAVNALTTPSSYQMVFIPRNVVNTPELAAELPSYSAEELRAILAARRQSLINGEQTLPSFSGSAASSLVIRVNNYAALWELARNSSGGRLIDVLDVKAGA